MDKRRRFKLCLRVSLAAYACALVVCGVVWLDPLWEDTLAALFLVLVLVGAAASGIAGRYSDYREEISPEELEELQNMLCELKRMYQETVPDEQKEQPQTAGNRN